MAVFTPVPKWSTGGSASKPAVMFNFFSILSRDAGVTIRSVFLTGVNLLAATTNRNEKKGVTSAAERGKSEPNVWEMFLAKNPAGASQPDGKHQGRGRTRTNAKSAARDLASLATREVCAAQITLRPAKPSICRTVDRFGSDRTSDQGGATPA